jgi:hypothetical protein
MEPCLSGIRVSKAIVKQFGIRLKETFKLWMSFCISRRKNHFRMWHFCCCYISFQIPPTTTYPTQTNQRSVKITGSLLKISYIATYKTWVKDPG